MAYGSVQIGAITTNRIVDGAVTTPKIADGNVTYAKLAPDVLTGVPKEGETLVVAASDSLNVLRADYRCDGVNDEVEINAAIAALPANGGSVQLLEGTYVLGTSITMNKAHVKLGGTGHATNITTTSNITMINVTAAHSWITELRLYGSATGGAQNGIVTSPTTTYCAIYDAYISYMGNCGIIFNGAGQHRVVNCYIGTNKSYGISTVAGSSEIVISACMFEQPDAPSMNIIGGGTTINGCAVWNGGINLDSSGNTVSGCVIVVCSTGVYVTEPYNVITGNVVTNCTTGIYVDDEYNTVSGNTCYNCTSYGIRFGANYNTISGNTCTLCTNGIYGTGSYETITGNNCSENTGAGVRLATGTFYSVFTGNICSENTLHGLHVDTSAEITITGNIFSGNKAGYSGIYFDNVARCVISSNIFDDNKDYGLNIGSGTGNHVIGNLFYGNDTGDINDGGTNTIRCFNADMSVYYNNVKIFEIQTNGDLWIRGDYSAGKVM